MKDIRIGIVGVGNCCSSLIQGIHYYKDINSNDKKISGLMHNILGGYKISDIKPVAAFDVDERKIGKDLSEAIFERPNCTYIFKKDINDLGVTVEKGPVMDGVAEHMSEFPEDQRFVVNGNEPVDVVNSLKDNNVDILINYLPVGSEEATRFYANAALKADCAFINCMPVFIGSNQEWIKKFEDKCLPIAGDDIKSEVGATITHRVLTKLFSDRGVKIERSYQLNFGGNTDFLNMLERKRLKSKKISKTEAVVSQLPENNKLTNDEMHIGPSDYVPWLKDNKICYIHIDGKKFGDAPISLECKLSVEDSPNSAGVVVDAIRCTKLALDRNIGGPLISASAYFMKHPSIQYSDNIARQMVEEFITGTRER